MGFRFRKRLKLFPGFSLNFSKNGLSSLSIGGPGATMNVPLARSGGTRTTVGIPGTGLSWTEESTSKPQHPTADLPDNEIHTGPRGGHWQWRQRRDGRFYKDYLSANEWQSVEQRRQAQRPAPKLPTTEGVIQELMDTLGGHDGVGDALWRQGLAQLVIDHDDAPRHAREAALLVKSPESAELHCRRAKGQAATIKAAKDLLAAVQKVLAFGREQGWVTDVD